MSFSQYPKISLSLKCVMFAACFTQLIVVHEYLFLIYDDIHDIYFT